MLQFLRLRPATFLCLAAAIVLFAALPNSLSIATRALIAWDAAAIAFIVAMTIIMWRTDLDRLRERAEALDGGRASILVVTLVATAASIAAIVSELASAKGGQGYGAAVLSLVALTIVASWTIVHLMFALHYAHEYYSPDDGGQPGGLKFPGDAPPLYGDFAHFAFVIGVANQTADISITSPSLRRVATAHGVAAFVFNTAIVALTINIAASLLGGP